MPLLTTIDISNKKQYIAQISIEFFLYISYKDLRGTKYTDTYHCVTGNYAKNPNNNVSQTIYTSFVSVEEGENDLSTQLHNLSTEYINDYTYYTFENTDAEPDCDSFKSILEKNLQNSK